MDLDLLQAALTRPEAYPHPVDGVIVCATHISKVFLAGPFAYKIKRPVVFDFLDYGTLERRRCCCQREVELNSRLAPGIYLDVVPITRGPDGFAQVGGNGPVVEWAVRMVRLPESARFLAFLEADRLTPAMLERLALRMAAFHRDAARGPDITACAEFDPVARRARDNLDAGRLQIGTAVHGAVLSRLAARTEAVLETLRPVIADRARRGLACETHGDLRLEHVYLLADRLPGQELVIVDTIEFNDAFRYADPVADVAFLAMDLAVRGRHDLAAGFQAAYLKAAGDATGAQVWAFDQSYRSAVRAKIAGLLRDSPGLNEIQRTRALQKARAHWLHALDAIETPPRRPALVLVAGAPGTGKSTLAAHLCTRGNFTWLRSDAIRKTLAGLDPHAPASAPLDQGIYTPGSTDATYRSCLNQAETLLLEGHRVVVDATFASDTHRLMFLEAADRLGVRSLLLHCEADPAIVAGRLAARAGDASDADATLGRLLAARQDPCGPRSLRSRRGVSTSAGEHAALAQALAHLCAAGLA
jgi:aminoglycoside phosphotransferase family enzyme/predicted kinase